LQGHERIDAVVYDGHKRPGDGARLGMLNNVATVNDAGRALSDQGIGTLEDFSLGRLAAAADEHGHAAGNFDDSVIN